MRHIILFYLLCIHVLHPLLAQPYPGLYDPDGLPHPPHTPNLVTGQTINVLDFGADTLDNATDDRAAIEAALESAVFGDEIYLPNGVYNIESEKPGDSGIHFAVVSGINWRGESRSGTVLKSGFTDKTIERFFELEGIHDVLISNLTLTSVWDGNYSLNTSINNPEAGGPKYMISIEDKYGNPSYNITIDRVFIEKFWRMGVRLSDSHDVVVMGSIFTNATDVGGGGAGYGVSVQGDGSHNNDSKFNMVDSCQFLGPYMRHGVLLQYATHNNAVRNNYLSENRLDAIDLHGEDEYLNEIYKNEVHDILTGAGVGVGNTGSTHDASGPHNYIHDNMIYNCREGVKVYIGSPDTRIEDNVITQSTVSSGKGIYVLNGPRTIVRGNQIFDNSGSGYAGIYLSHDNGTSGKGAGDPRDVQIFENEIYNNAYGVRLFAGNGIVYEDNNVYGNTIKDFYAANDVTFHKLLNISTIGSGAVELDPPGSGYPVNSVVKLTARRDANWAFSHWEGDLSGSENPDSLIMDDTKHVTAVFVPLSDVDEVSLSIAQEGSGTISLDPPGGIYTRGSVVTVTATPDSGWTFTEWQGDLLGSAITDTLVMDENKSITAIFSPLHQYRLLRWVIGSGDVLYDPPGEYFIEGTRVAVTAMPDSGWEFSRWGGDLSGITNPDTILMDSNKSFTVEFTQTSGVTSSDIPDKYSLEQNYPNPFNSSTTLRFSLKHAGRARLIIYDLLGQQVSVLLDQTMDAGPYEILFDGTNLPSGVYLYEIVSGQFRSRKKLILMK